MKRTTTLVIALWAMLATTTATAQKGTEQEMVKTASTLFNSGEYLKAYPLYSQLVSLYPNHTEYNYKFGACAIFSDPDKTKAVKFLTIATAKSDQEPMAWYYLGKAYHLNYQFKDAISAYEQFLRKADTKVSSKTDAQRNIETCIYGSNLLANIKDISVINKIESDKQNFFRSIDLTGIGGKILTLPEELKTKLDQKSSEPSVIHYPGNSTTIYFSSLGKDGVNGKDIYKANILTDGKFSTPEKLQGDVNTKYDEDYCFMHSDGKTLYFASKGHNSMGGYDIFKSILDPASNTFGPAVNLDFAINTPDDDIFYISDSLNQRAYFASSRSSDQAHINVYNVMVESAPLQIVYLKGYYINSINPDQKKATIQVKSEFSGKIEMESSTAMSSGNYMLYVQKPGNYTFKVKTENSPVLHEIIVTVPAFDKPVALKQEMTLVSENGKDKLVVVNHFELPLNEDLAALSAEMLRKKSGLEVNINPEMLVQVTPTTSTENITSLEHTMANAPLAAGYGDGVTVQTVITGMVGEKAVLDKFVVESDLKYANGYAYAVKKQREADVLLAKAEQLRKLTSNYASEEDVKKLRESIDLVKQAEILRRESNASIVAAESVKQYKSVELERSHQLTDHIQMLKQSQSTGNFDVAVQELKKERQRVQNIKSGETLTPYDELINKAKARESEAQRAEEKMLSLREEEKSLKEKLKIAEGKMSTSKKKSEIEAAETTFATTKSALDNTNRSIASQTLEIKSLGIEAKDAFANASLYKQLSENTEMNLNRSEQTQLSEQDKTVLNMKLKEMDSRVAALDISDPQTLALITDGMNAEEHLKSATASSSTNTVYQVPNVKNNSNQPSVSASVPAITNNTAVAENPTPAIATNNTAVVNSNSTIPTSRNTQDIALMRTGIQTSIARSGTNAPVKRMFVVSGITATNEAIIQLETKKKKGNFDTSDDANLKELIGYRNELLSQVTTLSSTGVVTTLEALRSSYNTVNPGYSEKLQQINNSQSNEIEKTEAVMDYKIQTIAKIKLARIENSSLAMASKDENVLKAFAEKDAQYEAAINTLQNETGDINQYRAAYDTQNKAVIESNALYAEKLEQQIDVTELYIITLEKLEADKKSKLNTTTNSAEVVALNTQLSELNKEKLQGAIKLQGYMKDLSLMAATSEAKASTTAVAVNTSKVRPTNLDGAIESSVSEKTEPISPEEAKKKVEKDAENFGKIFKTRVESESIFAYESGNFEEIIAQHQSTEDQLKNRDKIQTFNDQIFLIEAEMENEKSDAKLRKLDYKAEQIYLKRAIIEIGNAPVIAKMTQAEFKEELGKSQEAVAINKEKIDSRFVTKSEINQLFSSAEANMSEAAQLRKTAPAIADDIEKADYYRQAFAKEALAIEQVKQAKSICENIDQIIVYNEQELAQMRTGKVPNLKLAENLAAKVNNTSVSPANNAVTSSTNEAGSTVSIAEEINGNTTPVDAVTKEKPTVTPNTEDVANNHSSGASKSLDIEGNIRVTSIDQISVVDNSISPAKNKSNQTESLVSSEPLEYGSLDTSSVVDNKITAQNKTNQSASLTSSKSAENVSLDAPKVVDSKIATQNKTNQNESLDSSKQLEYVSLETPTVVDSKTVVADLSSYTERARTEVAAKNKEANSTDIAIKASQKTGNSPSLEAVSNPSNRNEGTESFGLDNSFVNPRAESIDLAKMNSAAKASDSKSTANSTPSVSNNAGASSANSEDYYYSAPEFITKDIFKRTTRAVYSANKPIPIDMPMPKGVYYKVQIGAFRNDIPQNLYDEFAPVCGENLNNGITRYTAGFFLEFKTADEIKREIRTIGYADAFVVAYRDGKRIPLYEAMGKANQQDFQAAVEKEYIFGDGGEAPVRKNTSSTNVASTQPVVKATSGKNIAASTVSVSSGNSNAASNGLKTNYYKTTGDVAKVMEVETVKGLFYTVQIGVYSKPVPAKSLFNIKQLNSELTETNKIRYTSGRFTSLSEAVDKRFEARTKGITDAFVTAYYNGKRISLTEADRMLKEQGSSILIAQ